MDFSSEQQRKAVFANLNPGTGVGVSSIGLPISSSKSTLPADEEARIITDWAKNMKSWWHERNASVRANKTLSKQEKETAENLIEDRIKKIDSLKKEIDKIEHMKNLTEEDKRKLIYGEVKTHGALPKEIVNQLEKKKEHIIMPIMPQGINDQSKQIVKDINAEILGVTENQEVQIPPTTAKELIDMGKQVVEENPKKGNKTDESVRVAAILAGT